MSAAQDRGPAGPRSVRVVGVGNILYRDEGVGVFAAHKLSQAFAFTPAVEIIDGALLGFSLLDVFADRTTVIVLDALLADADPGTIYRLGTDQLLHLGDEMTPTAHEIDPINVLKHARAFGNDVEMILMGIVPDDASQMALGLTPALADQFDRFVEATVSELGAQGVRAHSRRTLTLEQVIDDLSHLAPAPATSASAT
ncbi:MAG: hydrogenase maturation protease [Solirubrobacteraceae bacterium]